MKRLATAKLNELLASVLDNLLRMSEGKEHATSLDALALNACNARWLHEEQPCMKRILLDAIRLWTYPLLRDASGSRRRFTL